MATALRNAVAEARGKAQVLAAESGLTLGPVLNVEEMAATERASGFLGDEVWPGGFFGMRRRGRAPAGGEPEPLGTPSRTVTISVRVRFAVAPSPAKGAATAHPRR